MQAGGAPDPSSLSARLAALPALTSTSAVLRAHTRTLLAQPAVPICVILDDDPTGTQTVHAIPVLTTWTVADLTAELARTKPGSGFFILTNTRALQPAAAAALTTLICSNLAAAARAAAGGSGTPVELILRGDSTLRGHFPLEALAADAALGAHDAWLLAPFFLQGGRYTIADTHYVADDNDRLVPAADTPFARDAAFGYRSSDLVDWVVEKSGGAIPRDRVVSLGLDLIRTGGVAAVADALAAAPKGAVIVVNAAADEDMDVVAQATLHARAAHGTRLLHRTAASFVSARLGVSPIPAPTAADLALDARVGGLVLAGSHVPRTTQQLVALVINSASKLTHVALDVPALLAAPEGRDAAIAAAVAQTDAELARGQDVLVMTSRKLVASATPAESMDIGASVAGALVEFMRRLSVRPRYVIAKGGITASDVATKVLRMRRAMVVGQASSGVPLWRCDDEDARWPGMPFVVFPGNVGSTESLFYLVKGWRAPAS